MQRHTTQPNRTKSNCTTRAKMQQVNTALPHSSHIDITHTFPIFDFSKKFKKIIWALKLGSVRSMTASKLLNCVW